MPQKLNKAGKMQDYIPAGNGDPSGEYGTAKGTNKNFTASDKKSEANVITENKSVVAGNKKKTAKEIMEENVKNYKEENYNGHAIMPDLLDGYTVDYEGDEVWFKTKDEAKAFIDKEFGKKDNKANIIDDDLTGKKEENKEKFKSLFNDEELKELKEYAKSINSDENDIVYKASQYKQNYGLNGKDAIKLLKQNKGKEPKAHKLPF